MPLFRSPTLKTSFLLLFKRLLATATAPPATTAKQTMVSPKALLSSRTQVFEQAIQVAQLLSDNHEQTQSNPHPPEASASEKGTADGVNTTAMPAPSLELAQYIHSLIYQIPEIRQLVEAQGAAIQQHNEVLGLTQSKHNELAAQLSKVAQRMTHLAEREEGEMSEHCGASPPKISSLTKEVQGLQQEVKKMRGELSELQGKAVKYERGLVSRVAADSIAAQHPVLSASSKLPLASSATGSAIPTAPASMRQQNSQRSSQDTDAMNDGSRSLVEEMKSLKRDQRKLPKSQNKLATHREHNQLVKRNDNDKLVLKSSSAQPRPMSAADGQARSEFVTGCRQRLLLKGRATIEEFAKRHDYTLALRGSAGIHASRQQNLGEYRFRSAETARLHTNMHFWNGRIVNALDQAAMKGREQAGIKVVKDLVQQMERYRAGDNSVHEQCVKFEVNHEGIEIIKSWFQWTDELFDKLRSLNLFEVPGVSSTAVSRTIEDRVKWELAQKRLMGSPSSNNTDAKHLVPNSFKSSNKRRAVSPVNHEHEKRHAPGMFSSPIRRRGASPPSSPYSVDGIRRHGVDVFRTFDKRRALSPLSDAEIARRHADSFLKNLDFLEASSMHHSNQYHSPRGEPYRALEHHRERDYYGPGTNIRSDFYPDMPIQERRYRRGDYM